MQKILVLRVIIFFVLLLSNTYSFAALPPYTADQILAFKRVVKVIASPDGKQVAYLGFARKTTGDYQQWEYSLYLKDQNGVTSVLSKSGTMSALTWSPDGTELAFLTQGKKFQSIAVINAVKPDITKLLEFDFDITSFKWSPDSKQIALVATADRKSSANALSLLNVNEQHGNARLYIFPYGENRVSPQPITPMNYSLSQYFDWSPDSKMIVFAYQPHSGSTYANESKIALIDVATHKIKPISYTETHVGMQPVYSPDGKWIAFQSNLEGATRTRTILNDIELNNRVCVVDTATQAAHCLATTFNENPSILGWNQASDQIFVFEEFKTKGYEIYALSLDSAKPVINVSNIEGYIEPLTITLNQSGTLFGLGFETVDQAPEAFISKTDPFKLEQVSTLQTHGQTQALGKIQTIHWRSKDGLEIEGLLITPADYDASKKYPLLVTVHGGPAGAWNRRYLGGCDEYELMIDPTSCWGNLTSLGFVVLAPNIRGSTGYGKEFRSANFADFGGGDYRDMMAGVDDLIQKGIADKDHLAIAGWSFGGYMAAWAISQDNRFKSAVDGAGNTDFISFSGTSDIPYYYVKYLGTTFWDDNHLYLQRAPIMFVKNIKTPLLILHGENDFRVPISQAYELYTALRQQNKTVKFLVLPYQAHVPTDPNIIAESIKEVDQWLQKAM